MREEAFSLRKGAVHALASTVVGGGLYVDVPLEPTYEAAYRGTPAFWRDVLEGRSLTGF